MCVRERERVCTVKLLQSRDSFVDNPGRDESVNLRILKAR